MYSCEELVQDQMTLLTDGRFINVNSRDTRLSQIDNSQIMIPLQFIGLHDKNGTEIYKGDILKMSSDIKIRISDGAKFDDPSWEIFSIGYESPSFNCTIISQYNSFFGDLPATRDINTFALEISEIIGNIYENPELLETKP